MLKLKHSRHLTFPVICGAFLLSSIIATLFAVETFVVKKAKNDAAAVYFEQALRVVHSESTVLVGNDTYKVLNGSIVSEDAADLSSTRRFNVLRLAYAREIVLRSPVFSLDGTDPDALKAATARLRVLEKKLSTVQDTYRARMLVRSALYPTDLLDALADAQIAREDFLLKTSPSTEVVYERALARVVTSYKKDLREYTEAYDESEKENFAYMVPGGTVTKQSALHASELLKERISVVGERMTNRNACLQGEIRLCNILALRFPFPTLPRESVAVSLSLPRLVAETASLKVDVEGGDGEHAQIFAIHDTTCTKSLPYPQYFVIRAALSEDTLPQGISYVGDLLFYDAKKVLQKRDAAMLQYLFDHGIQYVPVHPTSFYVCPNIGSSHGSVFGLDAVRRLAAEYPMLAPRSAARLVGNHAVIREADALSFIKEAEKLAKSETLPSDVRDALMRTGGILRNKSAGFEFLVEQIAYVGEKELRMREQSIPVELGAERLFSTQSGFPSVFLAYNQSVGIFGPSVSIFENNDALALTEEIYRWTDIIQTVPLEELKEDMRLFQHLHAFPETFGNLELGTKP